MIRIYSLTSHLPVRKYQRMKVLDEPVKPFEKLDGAGNGRLDLARYMAEHIYMYSSENTQVKFRIVKAMVSDIIDLFGMNVRFSDETEDHVTVTAQVNEMAMKQFAKSFAPDVMVLEPKYLADEVAGDAEKTLQAYIDERGTEA